MTSWIARITGGRISRERLPVNGTSGADDNDLHPPTPRKQRRNTNEQDVIIPDLGPRPGLNAGNWIAISGLAVVLIGTGAGMIVWGFTSKSESTQMKNEAIIRDGALDARIEALQIGLTTHIGLQTEQEKTTVRRLNELQETLEVLSDNQLLIGQAMQLEGLRHHKHHANKTR
jgi:hypothetical protein